MMSNGQQAGGVGKDQLSAIGGMIVKSQTLDAEGKELSAYLSYLGTVGYISQCVGGDISVNQGRGSLPRGKTLSLFKMARKCLERAEEMYDSAQEEGRGLAGGDLPVGVASSAPPSLPPKTIRPSRRSYTLPTLPSGTAPPTPSLPVPPSAVPRAQSVPPGPSLSPSTTTSRPFHSVGTSYMREARLRNQYMMEQYKAHLRSQMQPHSQEMGLSMLRRLEENISVARIREQNLARKARERQMRLQQESETRAGSRKTQVMRLSQLSVEELRDQVASFEHGKHFPILSALKQRLSERHERLENLRNRLTSHPPSSTTTSSHSPPSSSSSSSSSATSTATEVYNFVNDILSNPDHPLSRLLGEYQLEIFTLLKPLHSARQKAGDDMPRMIITEKTSASPSVGCGGENTKPRTVSSPLPTPPHPTSTELTSSHPPLPTLTLQTEDGTNRPDLLYMNSDSDNEDELFTLSTSSSLVVGPTDSAPRGQNGDVTRGQEEGEDKLAELRAELERDFMMKSVEEEGEEEGGGGGCEDGGRCVTQLLDVVGKEEGEGEEGGGECGDGGSFVTEAGDEGEGWCVDGSMLTQLHTLREEEEGVTDATPTEEQPNGANTMLNEASVHRPSRSDQPPQQPPPSDVPDGAMFSRPPPPPQEPEEEEVVFRSLVPLSCRCYYGREEEMKSLKATAEPVLSQAVALFHSSLEMLEQLFTTCYPTLSQSPQREETELVLETLFFPALLPPLLAAYRCHNYAEEVATARNMCRHVNVTPKDLDVRKKFWLLEQSSPPYHEAISELSRVPELHSPSAKLTCLVSTSRQVVQCIDDYYETQGQPKEATDYGVGVDDILPIMSYVIIRSALPQLVSETALMEEFIQDGYVKGEEGFCLTSFMTALKFVSHMSS